MFYQLTTEWRESGLRPYLCTFPFPLDKIYNPPVPFRLAGSVMLPVTTRHEPHWRLMATNDTQFWMTRGKWRRTKSSSGTYNGYMVECGQRVKAHMENETVMLIGTNTNRGRIGKLNQKIHFVSLSYIGALSLLRNGNSTKERWRRQVRTI